MATYTIGSGGDYATFSAFEAAITLPEADRTVLNVTGTIAESFSPLDADYTNGLTIQAATGQEADGAGGGAKINGAFNPTTTTEELRVYNLNIRDIIAQNLTGVAAKFDGCDIGSGTSIDAVQLGSGAAVADFTNCIIRDGSDDGVYASTDSPNVTMNRCSFVNASRYNVLRTVLTNCFSFGAGNTDFLAASAGSDYNASGDTSAPGTTVYINRTSADFVDYAGGNFNLASGSSLQTASSGGGPIGASLSSAALSADSITAGTINTGDTVTIQLSNASASGKTLNVAGVSVTPTAQDASSISFLAMDLFTFASGVYRFDSDITITVVDGAESDTITFQISPDTGYTQFAVPDPIAGVWASTEFSTAIDPQVLAIGDYIWCTNPADSDAPNGSFPESSSIDYRIMDMSDGTPAWGSEGTITVTSETSGGFNSWKEWMESLDAGTFTTKLRTFLQGKGYSGSTSTMLYEYLKTVSSKASHQERKKDWEEGGWN